MMAAARVLVDALSTLKNLDGTLQEGNRKLALGSLISQLTESELVDIRLRLNAQERRGFSEKLPAELHHKILDYLSLGDSMNMRLVRLEWCTKFSSTQFCEEIIRRHFPEKHELYVKETKDLDSIDERAIAAAKNLKVWLEKLVRSRLRRARGRYESMSVYYCLEGSTKFLSARYCNGRIACPFTDEILIVKNICSESSERFLIPDRQLPRQWLLSDEYLIVASADQRTIYAWQLEPSFPNSQIGPYKQVLPSGVKSLSGHDNRVGIVLHNGEIYIWKIGRLRNPLSMLPIPWVTSNFITNQRREVIVIFHPYKRNTAFVCSKLCYPSGQGMENEIPKTRVQFYEYEGLEAKSRHTAYLTSTRSKGGYSEPQLHVLHDNFIGITNIGGFRKQVPRQVSDAYKGRDGDENQRYVQDTVVEIDMDIGSNLGLWDREKGLVMFDMTSKQFQCRRYYEPGEIMTSSVIPPVPRRVPQEGFLIWRDQTLSSICIPDLAAENPPEGRSSLLVTAVNHTPTPFIPASEVYWYREKHDGGTVMHRSVPSATYRKFQTAFHWMGGAEQAVDVYRKQGLNLPPYDHLYEEYRGDYKTRRVEGDDRFVVLFTKGGYVVWCFDPDAHLGMKGSGKDPTIHHGLL